MAISFTNKEYENGRLKRAELGNVQAREILKGGKLIRGTDEKLKDALLKDTFIIKVGSQIIGEQSFRMKEVFRPRLATAQRVVSRDKIQKFKDIDERVDLDDTYTLVNKAYRQEYQDRQRERKLPDVPTSPEAPKSPNKDEDKDKDDNTTPEKPDSDEDKEKISERNKKLIGLAALSVGALVLSQTNI